jgi:type 1 fimbria pilin
MLSYNFEDVNSNQITKYSFNISLQDCDFDKIVLIRHS